MPIAAGVIVGWPGTAASIPAGWDRVTALDNKYLKGIPNAGTNPGSTGGSASHSHGTSAHNHGLSGHSHSAKNSAATDNVPRAGASSTFQVAAGGHTHSFTPGGSNNSSGSASPGTDNSSNEQDRLGVIWIVSDGSPETIPAGAVALFGSSALPPGWGLQGSSGGRYLKGASAGANGGGTAAGSKNHGHTLNAHSHTASHSHPSGATGGPSAVANSQLFTGQTGGIAIATTNHTHQATVASTDPGLNSGGAVANPSGTNEPPFRTLGTVVSPGAAPPNKLIAAWLGPVASIPIGWTLCDGTKGTPDLRDKFVKGAATTGEIGTTGGAAGHSHASGASHNHSGGSHSHSQSFGSQSATLTKENFAGGVNWSAAHSSSHNVATTSNSFTSDNASVATSTNPDTRPPYVEVAFIMWEGIVDASLGAQAVIAAGLTVTTPMVLAIEHGLTLGVEATFDIDAPVPPVPPVPPFTAPYMTWQPDGGDERVLACGNEAVMLAGILGLDLPPDEQHEVPIAMHDGAVLHHRRRLPRELIFPIVITNHRDYTEFEHRRRRLLLDFDPAREGVFTWQLPDATRRQIRARTAEMEREGGARPAGVINYGQWRVVLRAVDPYWFGNETVLTLQSEPGDDFYGYGAGAPPYVISKSSTLGTFDFTLESDADVYPRWEIHGPTTGVLLRNETTDRQMLLTPTLLAGETLVVQTDLRVLASQRFTIDGANVWAQVAGQFPDMWPLEPGEQQLEITMNGTGAGSAVQMIYRPRYLTA